MNLRRRRCLPALLAAALLALKASPAVAQTALAQARADYEAGRYQRAADTLRAAVAQNPREAALHYWLARSEFELREFDHAASSAESAVDLDPTNSDYRLWLGRACGRRAEQSILFSAYSLARKSRRAFENAVLLNPSNFEAQSDLIEFYLRAPGLVGGGDEKALQQIESLSQVDPSEGHLARARYWVEKKRPEAADAEVRAALEAHPATFHAWFVAADYYETHKDAAGLQQAVEGAARADPYDLRLLYLRGVAALLVGNRNEEAERFLRNYIQSVPRRSDRPTHCDARVWLGQLYERENRRADALEQYRAAVQQEPHCKAAHEALHRIGK